MQPGQVQWDPLTGMPDTRYGMPTENVGPQWQYHAQGLIRQRQQALWGDAANSINRGINLTQSYRPGGSAAMASGLFQNQASIYANQAANLQEPDLLFAWRDHKQFQARKQARRAGELQAIIGGVTAIAALGTGGAALGAAGLGFGLGRSMGGGGEQTGAEQSPPGQPGPYAEGYAMPTNNPMEAEATQMSQFGPYESPPPATQTSIPFNYRSQQAGGYRQPPEGAGGGGGTAMSTMAPSGGGGGGSKGAPGGGRGGPGGAPDGFGGGGGGGSFGYDGRVDGPAATAASMQRDPAMQSVMLREMASDQNYAQSTYLMASSARRRLLEAQVA